jgi:DNA repair exonuclease SbcCD ATPase subunit
MAKSSIMEQIRQLEEQKQTLLEGAKNEALQTAQEAIEELRELGFTYRLVEEGRSAPAENTGTRKGTRQVSSDRPCPICNFRTEPPHDARRHRGQNPKKPFSDDELEMQQLRKLE